MPKLACPALGLGLLVFLAGCGETGPSTYPVTGKLTIGGQAPQGVSLTFHPLGSQQAASGVIDAQGNYTLFTGVDGKPGAEPGKYKVVLTQTGAGSMEMYQGSGGGNSSAAPVIKATFPEEWSKAETSKKEVEVTSGDNKIDIEVPAAS